MSAINLQLKKKIAHLIKEKELLSTCTILWFLSVLQKSNVT